VSVGTTRDLRADARALDAVADYRSARERGEWRRLLLPAADLRDIDMSGLDLDECDLTGAVLDGARFVGASLVRSCLADARLLGADFSYANLDRADLEGADATAAAFVNATLRRADLTGCRLHRADLSAADLSRANMFESDLSSANLNGALAAQANLRGAVLDDAVLTALRGEPLFDSPTDPQSQAALFGWPAARLAEPQLAELAGLYLNTQGWGIVEPSSWGDEGVGLMAKRDDAMVVVQVKATATPSPQNFTHLAQRLKRTTEGHPNVRLILVLPGPVPQSIQDLARANQISVLGVWVEKNTMRIEEVVSISGDPLRKSA
jgi:hypothetical protein